MALLLQTSSLLYVVSSAASRYSIIEDSTTAATNILPALCDVLSCYQVLLIEDSSTAALDILPALALLYMVSSAASRYYRG